MGDKDIHIGKHCGEYNQDCHGKKEPPDFSGIPQYNGAKHIGGHQADDHWGQLEQQIKQNGQQQLQPHALYVPAHPYGIANARKLSFLFHPASPLSSVPCPRISA